MITSDNGLRLIKNYESLRLQAYRCPAGVVTIGYGHTRTARLGQTITEPQADALLRQDIADAERTVNRTAATRSLNQNQFDALVSLVFNIGAGNYDGSTLRAKVITNPADPAIRAEFAKWVNAGGKRLAGLVKRRAAEADLYFNRSATGSI